MQKSTYLQLEQEILALIISNRCPAAECTLDASDFSQRSNAVIYQAIQNVITAGHAIDIISIAEDIETTYGGEFVATEYMAKLIESSTASARNMMTFCEKVKGASELRQARHILGNALTRIENNQANGVVEDTIKELMQIDHGKQKHEHTIKEAVAAAIEVYQEASEKKGMIGVPTGLDGLDDALGGFHDSDLVIVGARPATGKTALAFNFANHANKPAGIISAEQDYSQAGLRFISMEGLINSKNLRSANMTEKEYGRMPRTVDNLKNKPIFFNDEPGISITSLVRQARRWKQDRNIGIMFVDYIQKIKGTDKRQSTVERVTEVVNTLKDLARELNIPVVALSQVNREADKLNEPPGPAHLSDASACEKEADAIITMYRNNDLRERNLTLLHICKNRHGPTGDIVVNYDGRFFRFTDAPGVAA